MFVAYVGPLEILALLGAYSLRLHDFSPCSKATLIHYKKVINRHTCSFILLETHKQMKTNLSIMFSQGLSFDLPTLPPDMPRLALDLLQAVEADHSLTVLTQPTIKASTLQVNVQLFQVLCPHGKQSRSGRSPGGLFPVSWSADAHPHWWCQGVDTGSLEDDTPATWRHTTIIVGAT